MRYRITKNSRYISMFSMLIAGALIIWGIIDLIRYSFTQWTSYVLIGIGIVITAYQYYNLNKEVKVQNKVMLEFEENPSSSLSDIAQRTGLGVEEIREVVLNLRRSGSLKGLFSDETGQLETKFVGEKEKGSNRYCPHCGTPLSKDNSIYCVYCGDRLMFE